MECRRRPSPLDSCPSRGLCFLQTRNLAGAKFDHGVTRLEELGRKARDAFVELAYLQPKITVNDRVYLEQTSTVAELAVLARRVQVEREMMHTWAGSTKRIKLHGTTLAKGGFDLREKFAVHIRPNEIQIELPHARILSVEQEKIEVQALENGLWNRTSPEDVESQLAILPAQARARAADLRPRRRNVHPPTPRKISPRAAGACNLSGADSARLGNR